MEAARFWLQLGLLIVAISVCVGQRRPCNGTWSSWEPWPDCRTRCNGEIVTRTRNCEWPTRPRRCRRPQNQLNCTGLATERRYCFGGNCGGQISTDQPPIVIYPSTTRQRRTFFPPFFSTQAPREDDGCTAGVRRGGWGQWGRWSTCSNRRRIRYRECNNPSPIGFNNDCFGNRDESQFCNNDEFRQAQWRQWSCWSPCSRGQKIRYRQCNADGSNDYCSGADQETVSCNSNPGNPNNCPRGSDIVFALDSSGSVGTSNFNTMSDAVLTLIRSFDLDYRGNRDPTKVRAGVLTFASAVVPVKYLDDFNVPRSIRFTGGGTDTAAAIDFARRGMFQTNGDRLQNPNVLVVLTDGRSNRRSDTITAATRAKDSGIEIIAVGIGSGAEESELQAIASDPNSVYRVNNFRELDQRLGTIFRC